MKSQNRNRRSARVPATHNILLMVEGGEGQSVSKEVVTTVRISRHGAQLLGRRPLQQNSRGKVANLSTCRQAPFRIAWQSPSREKPGYHEIGIEFEEVADFWDAAFSEPSAGPPESPALESLPAVDSASDPCAGILEQLRQLPAGNAGDEVSDGIWCALVEKLEERRVISRGELITSLRRVGLQI